MPKLRPSSIPRHTTPGVPEHMHSVIALTTAGVEMDVLGLTYGEYDDATREAVVAAFSRTPQFQEDIIQAFMTASGTSPIRPFGNVKADVIADKEPHFHRPDGVENAAMDRHAACGARRGETALDSLRGVVRELSLPIRHPWGTNPAGKQNRFRRSPVFARQTTTTTETC